MVCLKKYGILLLPVLLTVLYLTTDFYPFRIAITLTCLLIVGRDGILSHGWRDGFFIIAAFAFSLVGDWMLVHSGAVPVRFIYGVAFFLAAHIGYVLFCMRNGKPDKPFLVAVVVLYLLYYVLSLRPAIPDMVMRTAVLAYLLVSCFSIACAKGLRTDELSKRLFFAGVVCLVFSDTLISIEKFLCPAPLYFLMLPTFFASQILITAAIRVRSLAARGN